MGTIDLLLIGLLKTGTSFIIANKLTFIGGGAILYKLLRWLADKSETTIDDSILTFIKNAFLRLIGKDADVLKEIRILKDAGLVNKKIDKKSLIGHIKQLSKEGKEG